jgi:kynureninase
MRQNRELSELGPFPDAPGYARAVELDDSDVLAEYRDGFVITDPHLIYLDGNSLGRLPKQAINIVDDTLRRQWGDRLIRSWNEGWWELQLELGDKLAPLLGARPAEVIISDSTSVNLFKLAAAAMRARPGRSKIITDDLNFPTDVYVLDGVARLFDADLVILPSDGVYGPVDGLARAIDDDTALVSLSHTTFKSGYTYDLTEITATAHESDALILWDVSHSVGALPIDFAGSGADFAVGCTYKYLNGGPGSPAFIYVNEPLQDELDNPITAWWGHAEPFSFDLEFQPITGIRRFHTGTMPTLSLAAIEAGIDDVVSAGLESIRAKSVMLSEFLIEQFGEYLAPLGFGLASPSDPAWRGSHVSLSHEEAWPITRAMIELAGVLPDFRAPDNIRLGLSPLYTTFVDIHTAVLRMRQLVEREAHYDFRNARVSVT